MRVRVSVGVRVNQKYEIGEVAGRVRGCGNYIIASNGRGFRRLFTHTHVHVRNVSLSLLSLLLLLLRMEF